MWPFASKKPPKVAIRVRLGAVQRLLSKKDFEKAIKKVLPFITKEEMEKLLDRYERRGIVYLRVSEKAGKQFTKYEDLFSVEVVAKLVPIEESCRCGVHICGCCIEDVLHSMQYSDTNLGLIADSVDQQEFSFETEEPLIYEKG